MLCQPNKHYLVTICLSQTLVTAEKKSGGLHAANQSPLVTGYCLCPKDGLRRHLLAKKKLNCSCQVIIAASRQTMPTMGPTGDRVADYK